MNSPTPFELPSRWRLLLEPGTSGPENMARDEAILTCGQPVIPTLRLYSFEPPAVTLGRFQDRMPLDEEASLRPAKDIVRRPTGGLAILHLHDLTYSVALPSEGRAPALRDRTYHVLSTGIISALGILGISTELVEHRATGPARGGTWCFRGEFGVDIEHRSRKICGSAQRVFNGGVLQHGTVYLEDASSAMADLLGQTETPPVTPGVDFISLEEAAGRKVSWNEAATAFREGFRVSLGIDLSLGALSAAERKTSRELLTGKYLDPAWHRGERPD